MRPYAHLSFSSWSRQSSYSKWPWNTHGIIPTRSLQGPEVMRKHCLPTVNQTFAISQHIFQTEDLAQMLLVRAPRARSPRVEKKSSISFSRRRLRFSASSRALSEFRSLISNILFFFLSCSISCSNLSIWAQRATLDSSSLEKNAKMPSKLVLSTPLHF